MSLRGGETNLKIHREAAIRALNGIKAPRSSQGKGAMTRKQRYSDASKEALFRIWRLMNYMASIRLKPALKDLRMRVESMMGRLG